MTENKKITVLIVDDSADSVTMLNSFLHNAGLTVLVALSGKQALSIMDQITPDVVLLDAIMPEMDGFETCRQIKAFKPELPIIFMTGLVDTDDIIRGLEAGAVDYVTKPINTSEILARLKVHVKNARNQFSAKSALDSAGQSIIAIDDIGNIIWATRRAQDELDQYQEQPNKLSTDLAQALAKCWRDTPDQSIQLTGFSHNPIESISATYLNQLGYQHLIRLQGSNEKSDLAALLDKLPMTQREAEVLLWLSKGKSNWDIATILAIKPRTINKHLEQIFKKLDVDNRTSAAAVALEVLALIK